MSSSATATTIHSPLPSHAGLPAGFNHNQVLCALIATWDAMDSALQTASAPRGHNEDRHGLARRLRHDLGVSLATAIEAQARKTVGLVKSDAPRRLMRRVATDLAEGCAMDPIALCHTFVEAVNAPPSHAAAARELAILQARTQWTPTKTGFQIYQAGHRPSLDLFLQFCRWAEAAFGLANGLLPAGTRRHPRHHGMTLDRARGLSIQDSEKACCVRRRGEVHVAWRAYLALYLQAGAHSEPLPEPHFKDLEDALAPTTQWGELMKLETALAQPGAIPLVWRTRTDEALGFLRAKLAPQVAVDLRKLTAARIPAGTLDRCGDALRDVQEAIRYGLAEGRMSLEAAGRFAAEQAATITANAAARERRLSRAVA